MTYFVIDNNVNTQLAAAAASGATTLTLASSANLPTLSAGQVMPLTLNDAATGTFYEVVYVTAISGVTLTVMRAQEGTGALNWNIGDYAFCAPTAGTVATALGNPNNTFQVAAPTAANQAIPAGQAAGVVGSARNLKMSVAAASATATMTADEIIVETALGGFRYCLSSFNKTINLTTTGAGGMDTGAAPTSGYVALYAIYNPTTATAALLATNATSSIAPNIYGGANMPSGYTASALVSVVPTTSASVFDKFTQRDRSIAVVNRGILITSSGSSTPTAYSTTAFPLNAIRVKGYSSFTTNVASTVNAGVYSDAAGSDQSTVGGTFTGAQGIAGSFDILIGTPQTIYYTLTASSGAPTWGINAERYDI